MYPYLEITAPCISCDNCRLLCPEDAVISDGKNFVIETWSCTMCSICIEVCPAECIKVKNDLL